MIQKQTTLPEVPPLMAKEVHLTIEPVERRDGYLRISATVRGAPWSRYRSRNGLVYFEIPDEWAHLSAIQGESDEVHDPLVRALFFTASEAGRKLVVHGRVSRSLLENLASYQKMIGAWWPRYRTVEIAADAVIDPIPPRPPRPQAIMGFSGGLDSCYTLYRHTKGEGIENRQSVGACLFVHGFDIPLVDDAAYDLAFERARRITDDVGALLLPLRTNLHPKLPWWPHTHPAAITGALSLFGGGYSVGLLASTCTQHMTMADVPAFGLSSTAWSDPLLSSDEFQVVHDEHRTRIEKSAVLRDWEMARRHLRVCWEGADKSRNCGVCEKCVRQMLTMRVAGIDDLSAFGQPFTPDLIRRTRGLVSTWLYTRSDSRFWKECFQYAQRDGTLTADELAALEEVVQKGTTSSYGVRRGITRAVRSLVEKYY